MAKYTNHQNSLFAVLTGIISGILGYINLSAINGPLVESAKIFWSGILMVLVTYFVRCYISSDE